jgi:hypothetical protein
MKSFFLFAPAIALGLAIMSGFPDSRQHIPPKMDDNISQITDGAFRDGLFLGKLAAERGAEPHIPVGRWATAEERASFTTGYQRGYTEFLASRVARR